MRLVRVMVVAVWLALLGSAARAEIRIVAVGDSTFRGGPSMARTLPELEKMIARVRSGGS